MDRYVEASLCLFLLAGTFVFCALGYKLISGELNEQCKPCSPPPVPVESIPGGTEWKYEPIPAPYGDTFTFSPGIFNLGDN